MALFKKKDHAPYSHIGMALVPPAAFTAVPDSPPPTPIPKKSKKRKVIMSPIAPSILSANAVGRAVALRSSGEERQGLNIEYHSPSSNRTRPSPLKQDEIYAEIKHHDSNHPGTSRSRKDQPFYPYRNSVADQSITSDDFESSPSGSPIGVVPSVAAGLRKKSTPNPQSENSTQQAIERASKSEGLLSKKSSPTTTAEQSKSKKSLRKSSSPAKSGKRSIFNIFSRSPSRSKSKKSALENRIDNLMSEVTMSANVSGSPSPGRSKKSRRSSQDKKIEIKHSAATSSLLAYSDKDVLMSKRESSSPAKSRKGSFFKMFSRSPSPSRSKKSKQENEIEVQENAVAFSTIISEPPSQGRSRSLSSAGSKKSTKSREEIEIKVKRNAVAFSASSNSEDGSNPKRESLSSARSRKGSVFKMFSRSPSPDRKSKSIKSRQENEIEMPQNAVAFSSIISESPSPGKSLSSAGSKKSKKSRQENEIETQQNAVAFSASTKLEQDGSSPKRESLGSAKSGKSSFKMLSRSPSPGRSSKYKQENEIEVQESAVASPANVSESPSPGRSRKSRKSRQENEIEIQESAVASPVSSNSDQDGSNQKRKSWCPSRNGSFFKMFSRSPSPGRSRSPSSARSRSPSSARSSKSKKLSQENEIEVQESAVASPGILSKSPSPGGSKKSSQENEIETQQSAVALSKKSDQDVLNLKRESLTSVKSGKGSVFKMSPSPDKKRKSKKSRQESEIKVKESAVASPANTPHATLSTPHEESRGLVAPSKDSVDDKDFLEEKIRLKDEQTREMIMGFMKDVSSRSSFREPEVPKLELSKREVSSDEAPIPNTYSKKDKELIKEISTLLKGRSLVGAEGVVLKQQIQEIVDENEVLKETVERLNVELSRYQERFGVNPDIEETRGFLSKNQKAPWLTNTKFLSPLFTSYDNQLDAKDDVIALHQQQFIELSNQMEVILRENQILRKASEQTRANVTQQKWNNMKEQNELMLEEIQLQLEQLEIMERKAREMHLDHVDEVSKLAKRLAITDAEYQEAENTRRKLKENLINLTDKHVRVTVDAERKIEPEELARAMSRSRNALEDLKENNMRELKEAMFKIKDAQKEKAEAYSKITELTSRNKQLQGEISALNENRSSLLKQIKDLQGDLEEAENRELECQMHLVNAVRVAERATSERATYAAVAEKEQIACEATRRRSMREKYEIGRMEECLKRYKLEIASHNKETSDRLREVEESHHGQLMQYERKMLHLKKLLEQKQQDFDNLVYSKRQMEGELETVWQAATSENRLMMDSLTKSSIRRL